MNNSLHFGLLHTELLYDFRRLEIKHTNIRLEHFFNTFVVLLYPFDTCFHCRMGLEQHEKKKKTFNYILTFLCLICRCVLCLGLRGHQDLDHKAKSIWTKELKKR